MNQPRWYNWPQIIKLENNCDNFWKFLKTLKTNVGFHFTRLTVFFEGVEMCPRWLGKLNIVWYLVIPVSSERE